MLNFATEAQRDRADGSGHDRPHQDHGRKGSSIAAPADPHSGGGRRCVLLSSQAHRIGRTHAPQRGRIVCRVLLGQDRPRRRNSDGNTWTKKLKHRATRLLPATMEVGDRFARYEVCCGGRRTLPSVIPGKFEGDSFVNRRGQNHARDCHYPLQGCGPPRGPRCLAGLIRGIRAPVPENSRTDSQELHPVRRRNHRRRRVSL